MLSFLPRDEPLSRRAWFSLAGISALGLSSTDAIGAREIPRPPRLFGRAKSCIVVFLFGGPGQQDLWDLKPAAPAEIRGEFRPSGTSVPGMEISDQLPRIGKQADTFTIIRSVSHADFEHGSASYTALTGHPHPKPGTNTPASRDDFPTYGAVVSKIKPTQKPVPTAATLGPVMHQGNRPPMAGQNAGFLGQFFDPFRIADDPNGPDFQVRGLAAPAGLTTDRMDRQYALLQTLDRRWRGPKPSGAMYQMSQLQQRAFGLLSSSASRRAFDLTSEKSSTRDAYGRHKFGQTLLLARRLVEAEVPLITVNWSKLNADQWDTHKNNYSKLRQMLPPFDRGMAALLADLDQRGLLDTTLVVCLGEFGRTPRMNKQAGRDHWPDCYSVLMAGGGVRRGSIYGASDHLAAYPITDRVAPWDLAATAYHLLGIDPHTPVRDRLNRPFPLSPGQVVQGLLDS